LKQSKNSVEIETEKQVGRGGKGGKEGKGQKEEKEKWERGHWMCKRVRKKQRKKGNKETMFDNFAV
jgi:hypothetical protein